MRDRFLEYGLRRRLDRSVSKLATPDGAEPAEPVSEQDIAGLPVPAQRYLRFMNVVGRPRERWLRVRFAGLFRLQPTQRWMRFVAWQHNTARPISRIFHMRLGFLGVLPMDGSDIYVTGNGRMRGRLLGVVPVANGSGAEFDRGELVTWLNDACLIAPSLLLTPATEWTPVNDESFGITVTDAGLTVTGRVFVDDTGRLLDFATDDRHAAMPSGLVRARWTTPIDGWSTHAGRPFPTGGRAIWHLPDGDFCYAQARFHPSTFVSDVTS